MGEERQDARNTPPGRKLAVSAAAEVLGISAEAVRSRIKRGTLRSVKEGSTVYVLLPGYAHDQARPDSDQTTPGPDQTTARSPSDADVLISHLEDEIQYLREENRRKDHIIAGLVERLPPALEPPQPPMSSAEASEGTRPPDAGGEVQAAAERPQEHDPTLRAGEEQPRQRQSLWRWILGGGS